MNGKIGAIICLLILSMGMIASSAVSYELPENDFEPPLDGAQAYMDQAENAAAHGAATFIKVDGYEPWAVLVINAGNPMGVDLVTVTFDNGVLRIEATDSDSTNHATILMNKEFANQHLADAEGNLEIETSDAVNYRGLNQSHPGAGNNAMYVFQIEHFSTQWIEISTKEAPFPGFAWVLLAAVVPVVFFAVRKKER